MANTTDIVNSPTGGISSDSTDILTNKSIDADNNTLTDIDNNEIKAAAAIALNKLAATTASRALVSDASGFVTAAPTTSTEIGYVNGVTSAIQTQLDAKSEILLSTKNFSGASSVTFEAADGISASTYKHLKFYITFAISTTSYLKLELGYGSTPDYAAVATYRYFNNTQRNNATVVAEGGTLVSIMPITMSNSTYNVSNTGSSGASGILQIYNANSTTCWANIEGKFTYYADSTGAVINSIHGSMTGNKVNITGVRFSPHAGTITGSISMYGIKT